MSTSGEVNSVLLQKQDKLLAYPLRLARWLSQMKVVRRFLLTKLALAMEDVMWNKSECFRVLTI